MLATWEFAPMFSCPVLSMLGVSVFRNNANNPPAPSVPVICPYASQLESRGDSTLSATSSDLNFDIHPLTLQPIQRFSMAAPFSRELPASSHTCDKV